MLPLPGKHFRDFNYFEARAASPTRAARALLANSLILRDALGELGAETTIRISLWLAPLRPACRHEQPRQPANYRLLSLQPVTACAFTPALL